MKSFILSFTFVLLVFTIQLTTGSEISGSSKVFDDTKSGKISLSSVQPKVKTVTIIISNKNGEIKMNGSNGIYASQFLRLIRKNISTEVGHSRKKAQAQQEEGIVVNNVGDIVRVHIERHLAPIFYRILAGLNIDVRNLYRQETELPTTTPWTPTTTKEYIYIIFEEPTTTPMTLDATTKKGSYKVVKTKTKSTTIAPAKDIFYVDDEDDSDVVKTIKNKGFKRTGKHL